MLAAPPPSGIDQDETILVHLSSVLSAGLAGVLLLGQEAPAILARTLRTVLVFNLAVSVGHTVLSLLRHESPWDTLLTGSRPADGIGRAHAQQGNGSAQGLADPCEDAHTAVVIGVGRIEEDDRRRPRHSPRPAGAARAQVWRGDLFVASVPKARQMTAAAVNQSRRREGKAGWPYGIG